MVVIVKRAQTFMMRNLESKSLCDPLYGEVAELLKFKLFHSSILQVLFRFGVEPRLVGVCDEVAEHPLA